MDDLREKFGVDFGMPTLLECATLEENALLCAELGLRFVEINMNLPQFQPVNLRADRLRETARRYGVYFTIHLDENFNFADFNPFVAQAWLETMRRTAALATECGAPLINMHLAGGVYFTLPEGRRYLFAEYAEQYLAKVRSFVDDCERGLKGSAIKICVENCGGFLDFQADALELLLASDRFALTLDVGHFRVASGADERIFRRYSGRIAHMHLHDALGKSDHLPLGSGEANIGAALIFAARAGCRVVAEIKTAEQLQASVTWLRAVDTL